MLDHVITRAWTAVTCDVRDGYRALPEGALRCLDEALAQWKHSAAPLETFRIEEYVSQSLKDAWAPVVPVLDQGTGFVIIDRVPLDEYSEQDARLVFWLLGQLVGPYYEQTSSGSLLFDVRDEGRDVNQGARYAVTNLELTYHTDNARSQVVPDYVALLCARPAKTGGVSQLVNAYAVHNELLEHYPDELAVLYEPFYFDRRGLSVGTEPEVSEFPIFEWTGHELLCRFIRLYIEVGHEKMGRPLTADQIRALDIFQQTVSRPEMRVEFALQRGQIQLANNRWILHNRTAFEDYDDPHLRRHLVRLWLARSA